MGGGVFPLSAPPFNLSGFGGFMYRLLLFLLLGLGASSCFAAGVDLTAIASANTDVLLMGGAVFGVHVVKAGYKWLRAAVLFEGSWNTIVAPPPLPKGQWYEHH